MMGISTESGRTPFGGRACRTMSVCEGLPSATGVIAAVTRRLPVFGMGFRRTHAAKVRSRNMLAP